jgi:2-phosphoglycerate kinase
MDQPRRNPEHVTIRDGKAGLPFSKGLLATSIMAAGLPPARAYRVAEHVEARLREDRVEAITTTELRGLTAQVLADEVGPRYAEIYRRWQAAQDRDVPLIVLIGGATGVGKSTIATTIAGQLGIVRIVSTDAIREVMRGILTREMMPALHTSSFDVPALVPDPPGGVDPVIAGFRQQAQAVAVGVSQLIRRAVLEGTDLIVEGAHLVPGVLTLPDRRDAIVSWQIVTVDDRQIHASHFAAREQDARSRGSRRYLDHFEDIRAIQDYLKALAVERGVPTVASVSLDVTITRVMEAVVRAATDLVPPPPVVPTAGGVPDPGAPHPARDQREGRTIRLDHLTPARGTVPPGHRQE